MGGNTAFMKHYLTPAVSSEKLCFHSCSKSNHEKNQGNQSSKNTGGSASEGEPQPEPNDLKPETKPTINGAKSEPEPELTAIQGEPEPVLNDADLIPESETVNEIPYPEQNLKTEPEPKTEPKPKDTEPKSQALEFKPESENWTSETEENKSDFKTENNGPVAEI